MDQLDFLPSQLRMRALYPDPYTYQDAQPNPGGMEIGAPPQPEPPPIAQIENDPRTRVQAPIGVDPSIDPTLQGNPDEQFGDTSANASDSRFPVKRAKRPISTVANDQFIQFLNTFPQRESPGKYNRISGALASFTQDPAKVEEALYGDYNRSLEDWKTKGGILSQAANFERATNQQILADEDRDIYNEYRFANLERQREQGDEANRIRAFTAASNAASKAKRDDIAERALKGGKVYFSKDGAAVLVDKEGNPEEFDRNVLEGLTFEQQERLRAAGAIRLVESRGDIQKEIERMREAARLEAIDRAAEQQRQTNSERPTAANTMSPTEERTEMQLAAAAYRASHPTEAAWIKNDENDIPIMSPPETNWLQDKTGFGNAAERAKVIDDFNDFMRKRMDAKRKSLAPPPTPGGAIQGPGSSSARLGSSGPKTTKGPTVPPLEQRANGHKHTFTTGPNAGKTIIWNGTDWLMEVPAEK